MLLPSIPTELNLGDRCLDGVLSNNNYESDVLKVQARWRPMGGLPVLSSVVTLHVCLPCIPSDRYSSLPFTLRSHRNCVTQFQLLLNLPREDRGSGWPLGGTRTALWPSSCISGGSWLLELQGLTCTCVTCQGSSLHPNYVQYDTPRARPFSSEQHLLYPIAFWLGVHRHALVGLHRQNQAAPCVLRAEPTQM